MLRLHIVNKTLRCIWRLNWQPRTLHSRTEPRALIRQLMTTHKLVPNLGTLMYPRQPWTTSKELIGWIWTESFKSSFVSLTHPDPSYAHDPMFPSLADNETSTTFGWVSVVWPAALLGGFHCAESRCLEERVSHIQPEVGGSRILYTPMRYMRYHLDTT